jgi:hypothetical protein
MRNKIFFFILATCCWVSSAEAFDLGVVGAANMTMPTFGNSSVTYNTSGQVTLGFGALVGFDILKAFQLEGAVLYIPRSYNNGLQTTTFTMLEIPVVFRFTALKFINFGAGVYYATGLGNYNIQVNTVSSSTAADYTATGINRTDFGVLASVGLNIPLLPELKLLADLRYYLGLQNLYVNPSAGTFNLRDLQLLAGIKFSF